MREGEKTARERKNSDVGGESWQRWEGRRRRQWQGGTVGVNVSEAVSERTWVRQ